ncbi:hypothetical protein FRC11_010121, partial [Ceratobasidium sp. 423]
MKFSRYLEETQIPEWKRAYLDYKLLKRKASAIKQYYECNPLMRLSNVTKTPTKVMSSAGSILRNGLVNTTSPQAFRDITPKNAPRPEDYAPLATSDPTPTPSRPGSPSGGGTPTHSPAAASQDTLHDMQSFEYLVEEGDERVEEHEAKGAGLGLHESLPNRAVTGSIGPTASDGIGMQQAETLKQSHRDVPPINTAQASSAQSMRTPKTPRALLNSLKRRFTLTSQRRDTLHSARPPASIDIILSSLNPVELEFFATLHQEVEKVDAFYKEREKDAILRVNALRMQMEELRGHKKLLDESRDGIWSGVLSVFGSANAPRHSKAAGSAENSDESRPHSRERAHVGRAAHDPDAYRRAKKKLKKAILEFYKGLEHLQNYRILNVTGFRKALKKFDKITKMTIREQYMRERVEGRDFTSGETCARLLKEVEQIYATQFVDDEAQGDEKKARVRLRASPRKTTHHYSAFRSGTWIGLSIPALGIALYR